MKISPQEVQVRLNWPLDFKLQWFANRYAEFMIEFDGMCYRSFSAGKDSDMGCLIIDLIHDGTLKHLLPIHIYKKLIKFEIPPRVFSNTGLEFPEIVEHAKSKNAEIIKPKMGFTRVIKEVGVAVGSKKIARMLRDLKNPTEKNANTRRLSLTGIKKDGTHSSAFQLPKSWMHVVDAPFDISDKCCDILKKEPFKIYEKKTGRKGIVFTMVQESRHRLHSYYQTGCNSFKKGSEKCKPLSIFTDADIWELAIRFNHKFASVYYDRTVNVEQIDGTFKTENLKAETTTGCTFCMFGLHLEDKKQNNRIQRLAISHPKFHDIIINKCGVGEVLDWLKLPYKPIINCQGKLF